MSKDFNNIEDIFKEAFDGFEANVDSSVWNNIQQNIGAGNSVTPNNPSSAVVGSSKALLTKLVAGIVITSGLATTTYFILKDDQATIPTEQVVEDKSTSIENVTTNLEETVENTTSAGTDVQVAQNTATSENEVEKKSTLSTNEKQISSNQKTASNVVTITNTNTSVEVINETSIATTTATNQSTQPKTTEKVKTEVVEFNPRIKSSTTKGKAPLDVEFNLDGNAVGYLWDFGDGTPSSSLENPFHTFAKPGKYKVTLTAIDKNANAKTVVEIITVENAITSKLAAIPTVFSPNGDGLNDIIKVEGEHITQFNAVVRDVKGNVVFEWDTIEGFWDGRDNGNRLMPAGTYYLVVVAVGADGEKHTVKQSIQLFQ